MALIRVEVAYARPDSQQILVLSVMSGCTAEVAIRQSGILEQFPEIDPAGLQTGIFGQPVTLDYLLQENDRVEIYRPLVMNPKDARRLRAKLLAEHK